jgi:co-chaperonin GroES (HSP10)
MPTPLQLLRNQLNVLQEHKVKVARQIEFDKFRGKNVKINNDSVRLINNSIEEYKQIINLIHKNEKTNNIQSFNNPDILGV